MSLDLVTVATFRILLEAEVAKLRLEAEGLTTFLTDAETVNMDWFLGNAVGNIKLQVPSPQAEAAAALLEEMRGDQMKRDEQDGEAETDVCLACGAALPEEQSRCGACGWSYRSGEDAEPDTAP